MKKTIMYKLCFFFTIVIWLLYLTTNSPASYLSFIILLPALFTYIVIRRNLIDIIQTWIVSIVIFIFVDAILKYNFYKNCLGNREVINTITIILSCTFAIAIASFYLLKRLQLNYVNKMAVLDEQEHLIKNYLEMQTHTSVFCFVTIIFLVFPWYFMKPLSIAIEWSGIYIVLVLVVCSVCRCFVKQKSLDRIQEIDQTNSKINLIIKK